MCFEYNYSSTAKMAACESVKNEELPVRCLANRVFADLTRSLRSPSTQLDRRGLWHFI